MKDAESSNLADSGNTDDTVDRDPLEAVAADFAERYRNGERVSTEEYAQRFPDLADQIRDLFPTISAMERLNAKRVLETGQPCEPAPKQLGDYRVIGEIARGGMGIVYEAEQITLGRRVAVKVLPQHMLRRPRDVKRFEREAQTAAKLHHSNIVPVFGVGQEDGHHYIVMQLIRGVGLDEILGEMKRLVAGEPGSQHSIADSTARSSAIQRSAAGLLEEELRRDSTVANCNGDTLASSGSGAGKRMWRSSSTPPPTPLQIRSAVSSEYYKNVARIGLQAAQALSYAHRHDTLHRDVKPGNLLLDEEGSVWMADFGLAKAIENDSVTCSGDVVGTLTYVAPERFRGETTARSDIYSLGLTLYEMLTLRRAFDGQDRVAIMNQVANQRLASPRKLNPAVPRDLETVVLKAASHDAADRYQTAGEMASDLEAYLADRPIRARPLSRAEHFVRWCRRNRAMAVMAASVVFLLATVFGVTVAGYVNSQRQRLHAEATSKLAVSALDEIYAQFGAIQSNIPVTSSGQGSEEELLLNSTQLPLSKDVALLLENLLRFYDDLSQQTRDSELVAIKSIAANRRVGDIRRRLEQFDEAQTTYEEAIERIERLKPAVRETEAVRIESARILNGLGIVLQENRRTKESIHAHREAIALLDHALATEDEQFELASSFYLLHLAERRGRWRKHVEEDLANLERAKQILHELEKRRPNTPAYRFLLARCLLNGKSGCSDDGVLNKSQAEAMTILEHLVEHAPDNAEYRFELGEAYRSLESFEYRKGRNHRRVPDQLAKSESRLRRGLQVMANLDTQHPNIPQYNVLKAGLHKLLASALEEQGRLAEAEDEYVHAIEKQQLVVAQQTHDRVHHEFILSDLELSHGQLIRDVWTRSGSRDPGELERARLVLEKAAAGLEKQMESPDVSSSEFRRNSTEKILGRTYVTLANIAKNLGETDVEQALLRKAEQSGS